MALVDSLSVGAGVGASIGGPVGGAIGAGLSAVYDSIFGSANKGSWQGSRFIPGDLSNRQTIVQQKIASKGLSTVDVDQQRIYDILTSEGIWQERIDEYLSGILRVKQAIAAGTYKGTTSIPITESNPTGSAAGVSFVDQVLPASFSGTSLPQLLLYGAGAFLVFKLVTAK